MKFYRYHQIHSRNRTFWKWNIIWNNKSRHGIMATISSFQEVTSKKKKPTKSHCRPKKRETWMNRYGRLRKLKSSPNKRSSGGKENLRIVKAWVQQKWRRSCKGFKRCLKRVSTLKVMGPVSLGDSFFPKLTVASISRFQTNSINLSKTKFQTN